MLILIRGLPGSGKSTLAKWIQQATAMTHFEADMYFTKADGSYYYDKSKIGVAHNWCRDNTHYALSKGQNVIVSNTFTQIWQMQPYIDMSEEFKTPLQVIECKGDFGNIHNVPEESLNKFKNNWESYHGN